MVDAPWSAAGHGVSITALPVPRITMLRLRGYGEDTLAAVEACLGAALPREPNRAAGQVPRAAWLAPGEWMITGAGPSSEALVASASGAAAAHCADVAEGRIVFAVTGPQARDLIAKGCTLDLHPRIFAAGHCAQSALAQVFVLIDRVEPADAFHIYADASYAHHLERWFEDAVLEFQLEKVDP